MAKKNSLIQRRARRYSPPLIVIALSLMLALASTAGAQGPSATQVGETIVGEAIGDAWVNSSVVMSADGSRIAAGATSNGESTGHVRVFDLVDGTWIQVGEDIDGETSYDQFGASVAMSANGSRIAAGALGADGNGLDSGSMRVFDLVDGSWTQVGQTISGEAADDLFGYASAISANGSRVIVGAVNSSASGVRAGHVRVFDLIDDTWTQVGQDIDGEAPEGSFGHFVAINDDGTRITASAPYNSANGKYAGQVRVFDLIENTWTQVGQTLQGQVDDAQFGHSIDLDAEGSRIVVGARLNDANRNRAGHVQVFDLVDDTWAQVGRDINGEASYDQFGFSVAISADGSRFAASAPGNDRSGIWTGNVRIFDLINGTWLEAGEAINGEAPNDLLGISVAANANVSRIVAQAAMTIDGAGYVSAFDLPPARPPFTCGGVEATIIGTPGDDALVGTSGVDVIAGLQGNDVITGLGGDDILCGGIGDDIIYGGQGFDIMFGAQGDDTIYSADDVTPTDRTDVRGMRAFGGAGNDTIYGSDRWDRMQGGPGVDQLFGYEGRDWMRGGADSDAIDGGEGIDDLHGGNGNDTIFLTNNDTVRGGAGAKDTCEIVGTPARLISCELRR